DGVAIRSLLWSAIRFSEPEIEIDKDPQLRREGILALSETAVERTIPMVARKRSGEPDAGGSPAAVALSRWRSHSSQGRGGVATCCGKNLRRRERDLRSRMKIATVATDGNRSEIPWPHRRRHRHRIH